MIICETCSCSRFIELRIIMCFLWIRIENISVVHAAGSLGKIEAFATKEARVPYFAWCQWCYSTWKASFQNFVFDVDHVVLVAFLELCNVCAIGAGLRSCCWIALLQLTIYHWWCTMESSSTCMITNIWHQFFWKISIACFFECARMTLLLGPPGAGKSTLLLAFGWQAWCRSGGEIHYSCLWILEGELVTPQQFLNETNKLVLLFWLFARLSHWLQTKFLQDWIVKLLSSRGPQLSSWVEYQIDDFNTEFVIVDA